MGDHILLKWGSFKGWDMSSGENDEAFEHLLKAFDESGRSLSAMAQRHTDEEKQELCKCIDAFEGEITNDWDGETYDKERAKKYIMEYGK